MDKLYEGFINQLYDDLLMEEKTVQTGWRGKTKTIKVEIADQNKKAEKLVELHKVFQRVFNFKDDQMDSQIVKEFEFELPIIRDKAAALKIADKQKTFIVRSILEAMRKEDLIDGALKMSISNIVRDYMMDRLGEFYEQEQELTGVYNLDGKRTLGDRVKTQIRSKFYTEKKGVEGLVDAIWNIAKKKF